MSAMRFSPGRKPRGVFVFGAGLFVSRAPGLPALFFEHRKGTISAPSSFFSGAEKRRAPLGWRRKKDPWYKPMGPVLLSKGNSAVRPLFSSGTRRTPRRTPTAAALPVQKKSAVQSAQAASSCARGRIQERGLRPPSWSFQGDGFLKGRGKSKSPFP